MSSSLFLKNNSCNTHKLLACQPVKLLKLGWNCALHFAWYWTQIRIEPPSPQGGLTWRKPKHCGVGLTSQEPSSALVCVVYAFCFRFWARSTESLSIECGASHLIKRDQLTEHPVQPGSVSFFCQHIAFSLLLLGFHVHADKFLVCKVARLQRRHMRLWG